ncbi:protein zyg-11 homolog B [Halictus rubicundus]|uniref:protein zyg-11 homolog B n=1 Tax=Halictus rubicundus TaxID=77578 RepID=UPI0040353CF5
MFESPRSLREVCIDFICDNILNLCVLCPGSVEPPSYYQQAKSSTTRISFKHPNIFIPAEISELLLSNLCEKKALSDLTITLFDSKSTRLRCVQLKDASVLSAKGLKVLKQHKVQELVVNGLNITVNDLISCLGDWSLQNLRSLSIAKGSFQEFSRYCVVVTRKLKALNSLNVSGTEFNKYDLEIVVNDLPLLENLDISCTKVDDITPLKNCKNRLKTLYMYDLKINENAKLFSVLLELNELRHLDISELRDTHRVTSVFNVCYGKPTLTDFLKAVDCMPYLISLDLSGKVDINLKYLKKFIKAHPDLTFLGLVYTLACYEDSLTDSTNKDYRPNLVVSGIASEAQTLEALRRYTSRPVYLEKGLLNLFRLTHNFFDTRVDVIKLVLAIMREHQHECGVQLPSTACLYNLTKGELATMVHPSILKQVVELTMVAMESYPANYRLHMNALLTLCSDKILQINFDKFRCAKLVMNSMLTFNEPSMTRMSVAIASITVAKISPVETSMLAAHPQYMSKLLAIVRSKVEIKLVDTTMKFTLSVLWNLTDESARTCSLFMAEGGMDLFLEMLETFQGASSVETKVLGLINNIAEVSSLRPRLMERKFLSMLSTLLVSTHIDISYFAAGITAHLLSDGKYVWWSKNLHQSRALLLKQLAHTVKHWQTPQGEMVAYRSFQPFFPLLHCPDAPVRLWAVWAIQHVITKNPKHYCSMLIREEGVEILKTLETSNTHIENLRRSILEMIKLNS